MSDCKRCGKCCGPVPMDAMEKETIERVSGVSIPLFGSVYMTPLKPAAGGEVTCHFYDASEKACLVYEHRPLMCRLFGESEEPLLKCRNGYTSQNPMSIKETREVFFKKYAQRKSPFNS